MSFRFAKSLNLTDWLSQGDNPRTMNDDPHNRDESHNRTIGPAGLSIRSSCS